MAGGFLFLSRSTFLWELNIPWLMAASAIIVLIYVNSAYQEAKRKRFINKRFEALWSACKDRHARLKDVLGKMRREQIADLREMPRAIEEVARALYVALRRSDIISNEVERTEGGVYSTPPSWPSSSNDPQAREL